MSSASTVSLDQSLLISQHISKVNHCCSTADSGKAFSQFKQLLPRPDLPNHAFF